MKRILLTQGKYALVDDEDYPNLSRYSWYAHFERGRWYALRHLTAKSICPMHRQILNTPIDKQVDHRNSNGLDNRRCNIRNCTSSQNHCNTSARIKFYAKLVELNKIRLSRKRKSLKKRKKYETINIRQNVG